MPYLDAQGALPYQHGSDTSRDAALRAQAFIGQQGQDVLTWIASQGEAGCYVYRKAA
jgi:hypothetical protein